MLPLQQTAALSDNLPPLLTSFVGRRRELGELHRLIKSHRLVTLTGIGGCGKTRLALRAAEDLRDDFPSGVVWVDLAPLGDPALVPQAVMIALGVHEEPGRPGIEAVIERLGSKKALLVLDNCEHLPAACAHLTTRLLTSCPRLHIIATSRERLSVASEYVWAVPPLSLPELPLHAPQDILAGHPPRRRPELGDAVRLFEERARRVAWRFGVTEANLSTIIDICRTLEGLPLAIEQAAVWVNVLTVQEIQQRLRNALSFLSRTPSPDARHGTMRATLAWSYRLLTSEQQRFFRRLAIFAGDFSLEAADAVTYSNTAADTAARDATTTLDSLATLIDKSLLTVPQVIEGASRYRLLEPVRQFAWSQLVETQEVEEVRQRHALFYRDLVVSVDRKLPTSQPEVWNKRMEVERHNLRVALVWAAERGEGEIELQLATCIKATWRGQGRLSEVHAILEATLERTQGIQSAWRARALADLADVVAEQGNFAMSAAYMEQALALYDALGDTAGIMRHKAMLAFRLVQEERLDEAIALMRDVRELARERGDLRREAAMLSNLGQCNLRASRLADAEEALAEALALFQRIDDTRGVAVVLENLGRLAQLRGDLVRARTLMAESLTLNESINATIGEIESHLGLASLACLQADYAQALEHYHAGLTLCITEDAKPHLIACLIGLAAVAAATSATKQAVRLFAAARALRERTGVALAPTERALETAGLEATHTRLPESEWNAEWQLGQLLPLERIVEMALATGARGDSPMKTVEGSVPLLNPNSSPGVMLPVRLYALGPARIYRGEALLTRADFSYEKPKTLLFYLLTHNNVTKEQIGLALWPDAAPKQVYDRIYDAVSRLRRALGSRASIIVEEGRFRFNRDLDYWFDAEILERAVQAWLHHQSLAAPQKEMLDRRREILAMYQGEFLSDFPPDDWILAKRADLQNLWLAGARQVGNAYFSLDCIQEAGDVFRQIIAVDRYAEDAHRQLMRCDKRLGNRSAAIHHYHTLRESLLSDLGVLPDDETTALYERIVNETEV